MPQHPFEPQPENPDWYPDWTQPGRETWAGEPFVANEGGGIEHTHFIDFGATMGREWRQLVVAELRARLPRGEFGFR